MIRILFVLMLLPSVCFGWGTFPLHMGVSESGDADVAFCDSFSGLVCEDFEGTGQPSGWTTLGGINYDYQPAIAGMYSVQPGGLNSKATSPFFSENDVYIGVRFNSGSLDNASDNIFLSIVGVITIRVRAGDNIRAQYGATTYTSGTYLTPFTDYYLWVHYISGTGSDGVLQVWIGESGVFAGASVVSNISTGGWVAPATGVSLENGNSAMSSPVVFDNLLVQTTEIGDM